MQSFIAEKMVGLKRTGIVVPISGGLDSSVVAALCVNAVGKEKVTGLLLPEKQGNPDAGKYAHILAQHLGIQTKTIDISATLRALGTYKFALSFIPTRKLKETAVKQFMKMSDESVFLKAMKGTGDSLTRHGIASFFTKQRVRLVVTYKYAEENNLLVVGSAHKSEDLVGLYVKFGVDDAADLMPLKNLYRTHILQIAEELGIPAEITGRSPNPDLIPGVTDKYQNVLDIPAEQVDLILYGIEQGASAKEICKETGLEEEKVNLVFELYETTSHMRNPSMAPNLPGFPL